MTYSILRHHDEPQQMWIFINSAMKLDNLSEKHLSCSQNIIEILQNSQKTSKSLKACKAQTVGMTQMLGSRVVSLNRSEYSACKTNEECVASISIEARH
ncbi:hypothetical protein CEXT_541851 [Caerostris extrusa]|uniref:Uncharacterized protein n=1 Tax=Caerostris extrusa TaxID=172846 RepID=A0AAV4U236_CAEEX|nr:hypothetical protein CEXT_541851 [Caerostris extrusa]